MKKPFVGLQLSARNFIDRGLEPTLDAVRRVGVNTLLVYSHTYHKHAQPAPGEPPERRVWADHRESFFAHTPLRHPSEPHARDAGRNIFQELAEPCRARDLDLFVRILGPWLGQLDHVRDIDLVAAVDHAGRPTGVPCWNRHRSAYAEWWRATVHDLLDAHPHVAGLQFGFEHAGPLSRTLFEGKPGTCFCPECESKARARGLDPARARAGYAALQSLACDEVPAAPPGSWSIALLRILMAHPEVLAWDRLMFDTYLEVVGSLRDLVRSLRPGGNFILHVDHQQSSYDPVCRANFDYPRLAAHCDHIKPILYHDVVWERFRQRAEQGLGRVVLRDFPPAERTAALARVFGLDPAAFARPAPEADPELASAYVSSGVREILGQTPPSTSVIAGIGVNVAGAPHHPAALQAAVRAAFAAGARGILVSREYEEMSPAALEIVAATLRELGVVR